MRIRNNYFLGRYFMALCIECRTKCCTPFVCPAFGKNGHSKKRLLGKLVYGKLVHQISSDAEKTSTGIGKKWPRKKRMSVSLSACLCPIFYRNRQAV